MSVAAQTAPDLTPLQEEHAFRKAAAQELLDRRRARANLIPFCQFTYPGYKVNWHHEKIAKTLEQVSRGHLKRVIFETPPRHGKSELTSIRFPAWHLGHHPQDSIIETSYAERLSINFSRQCRETVLSPQYQRLWARKLEVSGNLKWMLSGKEDGRSSYIAAGIGGAISGEGANVFIIDDPTKTPEQAYSQEYRNGLWSWYKYVARTRLEPGASIVVVQTRWHADDLAGRLQKQGGWTVVKIPAQDESGEVTGRKYVWLWSDRFSAKEYEDTKVDLGPVAWAALYQQNPTASDGTVFKREYFRFYRQGDLPQGSVDQMLSVWDTAHEEKQENDFSATIDACTSGNNLYLLDAGRWRFAFPKLLKKVISRWRHRPGSKMLIENKGSGISLRQTIVSNPLLGIVVVPMPANLSKQVRGNAVSGYAEAGFVYLPHPDEAPWVEDFLEEICGFPGGAAHDDWYDCLVHLMTYIYQPAMLMGDKREEVELGEEEDSYRISGDLDDLETGLQL